MGLPRALRVSVTCFELELLGNNIESPLDLSVFRYSPMHELTVGTARNTSKLGESLKDEPCHLNLSGKPKNFLAEVVSEIHGGEESIVLRLLSRSQRYMPHTQNKLLG